LLRELRLAHFGKQLVFASAMGVTEAAVSYWESGQRVPGKALFREAVQALLRRGASDTDVEALEQHWREALLLRCT
jgi:transcriptional regulator with XRE-family HTH domain